MIKTYEIETDIPLSAHATGGRPPLPLGQMEVGNSLRVEYERRSALSMAIRRHVLRNPETKFATRTMIENAKYKNDTLKYIRVWRIA
jgi:hypothetical protein